MSCSCVCIKGESMAVEALDLSFNGMHSWFSLFLLNNKNTDIHNDLSYKTNLWKICSAKLQSWWGSCEPVSCTVNIQIHALGLLFLKFVGLHNVISVTVKWNSQSYVAKGSQYTFPCRVYCSSDSTSVYQITTLKCQNPC